VVLLIQVVLVVASARLAGMINSTAVAVELGIIAVMIVASTILPAIIYGSTIVLYLAVRKRLDRREGAFSLGRFELPVAIGALVWVVCALFALTVPAEALVPDLIVAGLITAGGLYFLALLRFRREALEPAAAGTSGAAGPSGEAGRLS
jgi:hypothetical protein